MSQKPVTQRAAAEKVVKDIRRAYRCGSIRSIDERGVSSIRPRRRSGSCCPAFVVRTASPNCAAEGIAQSLYYSWSKRCPVGECVHSP